MAAEVRGLQGVVDQAGRRYFGGQALPFGEEQRTLDTFLEHWEVLHGVFNEGVVAEGGGLPVPSLVALDPAARPGRHPRGRNARQGDGRDRHARSHDGPPGVVDLAHQ